MITEEQKAKAQAIQHAAAHDPAPCLRLVAGPGTGKSTSIVERVCWLLREGVPADQIWAVSFTRASALDLRINIHAQHQHLGHEAAKDVGVTTQHSLALRLLRKARMLEAFPANPMVLDNWEVENIFDAEFGHTRGVSKKRRQRDIRRAHEAFWSTGNWEPPNYILPDPKISDEEKGKFQSFHPGRTQSYCCVLPGEIVRLCVERMDANLLNAVELMNIRDLIVDEFQDLNPNDLKFVDLLVKQGARVFIAGDDDQSIYAFRFASPAGIQTFPDNHAGTMKHQLAACFRCPPKILSASMKLMASNASDGRIPKTHFSLYSKASPPIDGCLHLWKFGHANHESRAIVESCKKLIAAEMNPRDILILLSNQKALAKPLIDDMAEAGIEAEHPREDSFLDSDTGRLALAVLRIVCDSNDYISHRTLLGLRNGVAVGKCVQVYDAVVVGAMNYRAAFYDELRAGVFTGLALSTITAARETCKAIDCWTGEDTLERRAVQIAAIIDRHYDAAQAGAWLKFIEVIPPGVYLKELRDFLWADNDEQQRHVLEAVMHRLSIPVPEQGPLPPRVRIMTMHGAKGLSGRVVFIPGLEEEVFPGPRKRPYLGLVQEAARMLYVSITRARAACIVSFAYRRMMEGKMPSHTSSRFASQLGGAFEYRSNGMTDAEVAEIMGTCKNL
jgi:superfamily I DNA/RNA helicase